MEKHILIFNRFLYSLAAVAMLGVGLPVRGEVNYPEPSTTQAPSSSPFAAQADAPVLETTPAAPNVSSPAASTVTAHIKPPAEAFPDLWTRIRKGFAMPDLDDDYVRNREQWYATRPDYIIRMTERSSKYLYHIVEELERRNMPTELALLPFIESAFNPQAVSTAKAAGMWQFIPGTGRDYRLKQNAFMDERRDVLASTRAALDYLQKLHGMFGDWQLALAAYNWGEGSVSRAIKRNQALGLGTSYSELKMPNETRYYVPKLQAVKNIVARPSDFNAPLPSIADHPYFQSVALKRDIDVSLAARLSQVHLDDFRALNPSANKPVLLAAGTSHILLPWDNAAVFEANLQNYDKQLASWTAWHAPRNMKLSEAAKAVGMSETHLREINHIPARMMLKAGSVLLVPRSAKQADNDVPEHVAENGQTLLLPEAVPPRKMSAKAKKGETVSTMAKRLKVNAHQLAQWNQLGLNEALKPGQSLVVLVQSKAKAGSPKTGAKKSTRSSRPVAPRRQKP
jgi:membrane-bound lytic murein transglycosylase D